LPLFVLIPVSSLAVTHTRRCHGIDRQATGLVGADSAGHVEIRVVGVLRKQIAERLATILEVDAVLAFFEEGLEAAEN
jgi:hypothetical protein